MKTLTKKSRIQYFFGGLIVLAGIIGGAFYLQSEQKDTAKDTMIKPVQIVPSFTGSRLQTSGISPRWSIVIPDGWEIERKSWSKGLIFADILNYSPGKGLVYTDTQSKLDISRFSASSGDPSLFPDEYNTYKKSEWKHGKLNGTLYYHEFAKGEKIGNYTMQGGEKDYTYYFVHGDYDITISYFILSGDQDQHELVEKVVASLELEP